MKQNLMKMASLCFAVVMLLCILPIAFAQEHAEIIESYNCDKVYNPCDFSWDLYDDGTLIIDGHGSLTNHMIVTENVVKKIIINDTVSELSADVFWYLEQITCVEVSDTHPSYTSSDGVLFSKDCSVLVYYPRAKSTECYTVPSTVKTIGSYAFFGAQLKNVEIADSVELIDYAAFLNAQLKSVVIPCNVQTIAMSAFQGSMLETVFFESNNRNLFIDQHAFADCENLTVINLNACALYGINSTAFDDTAFYKNEANWEDGVLYINDILLDFDTTKMDKEYVIKDSTIVIADCMGLVYVEPGEEYEGIEITIPKSVDNFGMFFLNGDETLENVFRVGRSIPAFSDSYTEKIIALRESWESEFGVDINSENISVATLKALPQELLIPYEAVGGFVQSVQPLYIIDTNVNVELFMFDNIKGFSDDNLFNYSYTFSVSPTVCNGYVLADSVELIGRFSPFNEKNTLIAMQYFFDGTDDELDENLAREKSLTFLNADCYINDAAETIWHGYTICGYPDSTAYEYAMKYDRKFVDITNCTHAEISVNYYLEATCSGEGYTGDVYCQYCGEFLEEGTIIPKTENHSFGEWEIISKPSCVKDGTRKHSCELCGKEATEVYQPAYGHKYIEEFEPATCTSSGYKLISCENCSWYEYEKLSATGHKDDNNDYKCDVCGEQLKIDCNCNCHKTGFMGFIYKITQFFWRLFRINQVCGCGAYHY